MKALMLSFSVIKPEIDGRFLRLQRCWLYLKILAW